MKLFATMSNITLTKFYNDNYIPKYMERCFREGYKITNHVIAIKDLINLFLFKNKNINYLYLDYRNVFDLVWRELCNKLVKEGINGVIIRVIKNMYNNIKSCGSIISSQTILEATEELGKGLICHQLYFLYM